MFVIKLFPLVSSQILWSSTFFENPQDTLSPFFYFNGTIQPYLLNTSRTINIYLQPLFHLLNRCISTKSQHHIWSTRRRVKLRVMDSRNSPANFSCQLHGFFRFLIPQDRVFVCCWLKIVLFDPILAFHHIVQRFYHLFLTIIVIPTMS